jgi:FkbM family methyltransferase
MTTNTFEQLHRLLSEQVLKAAARARTSYDSVAGLAPSNIVIFGAGRFGRLINKKLREVQIQPLAFTDNNLSLWGKQVDGIDVLGPTDAASKFGKSAVFLVAIWNGEAQDRMADRIKQLSDLGCQTIVPFGFLFWKYHDVFLPHYCLDLPEKVLNQRHLVSAAMQLWSDDFSREEFVSQVGFRISMDFDLISRTVTGRHYFPRNLFSLLTDEVFVDCGAFDGDTVADFVQESGGDFKLVKAFEPDPITFPNLQKRVKHLDEEIRARVHCTQEAVGRNPGSITFDATGTMLSVSGRGSTLVSEVNLDSALASLNPTFIKFDVEGFELDALAGAMGVLSRSRPILAVSAYHEQSHLWRVPLFLSSLVQERYQFFLRPHGSESWDLVCYAIPEERVSIR